jgi:RNA polymerase sigma-70 factor (ECF subfamily)
VRAADDTIRFVIYRLVGDDVDDVLQNAYLKAFRSWDGFRGASTRRTWLHRIAYTTALDHLRTRRRARDLHRRSGPAADVPDIAPGAVDNLALVAALDRLSTDHRVAVLLVDGQGFSHSEVAEILDVAPGTVASRVHRARTALRTMLSEGSEG